MTELLGYADRRSARPGDRVALMVSSDAHEVRADLVRFVDGSPDPESAPARWEPTSPPLAVEGPGGLQEAGHGSHADLPLPHGWDVEGRACLRLWFTSTTPPADPSKAAEEASQSRMTGRALPTEDRRQVIAALGREGGPAQLGVAIAADGRLTLELDGAPVGATRGPVLGRVWYGLLVTVDGSSVLAAGHQPRGQLVHRRPRGEGRRVPRWLATARQPPAAARDVADGHGGGVLQRQDRLAGAHHPWAHRGPTAAAPRGPAAAGGCRGRLGPFAGAGHRSPGGPGSGRTSRPHGQPAEPRRHRAVLGARGWHGAADGATRRHPLPRR